MRTFPPFLPPACPDEARQISRETLVIEARCSSLRDDDHVGAAGKAISFPAKQLSYEPLDAISLHSVSDLARDRDSEPRRPIVAAGQDDHQDVPAVMLAAPLLDPLELGTSLEPIARSERAPLLPSTLSGPERDCELTTLHRGAGWGLHRGGRGRRPQTDELAILGSGRREIGADAITRSGLLGAPHLAGPTSCRSFLVARGCEPVPAFGPTSRENLAAIRGGHARAETVGS